LQGIFLVGKARVFVFGSHAVEGDDAAFKASRVLAKKFPQVEFVECEDPFALFESAKGGGRIIVLDAARGVDVPREVSFSDIYSGKEVSLHGFDLAKVLKLLEKTDAAAARRVKIIALPLNNPGNPASGAARVLEKALHGD
jgi:hypothetical protein